MNRKSLRRAAYASLSLSLLGAALAQTRPDTSVLPAERLAAPAGPVALTLPRPLPDRNRPWITAPAAREAIMLERMTVHGEVAGHAARTRIEMVFRNPNAQVLEGELQFPLFDGQTVAGFALDIDGELREAVPVDKAKGQQVFEDTIRRRVDPALLEMTQGNHYKLRVYPLPANGTRRVVLEVVETLPVQGGQALYRLPLAPGAQRPELDFRLTVAGRQPSQVRGLGLAASLSVTDAADGLARFSLKPGKPAGEGEFTVALAESAHDRPVVSTQYFNDRTYFYAEVPVAGYRAVVPRPAPRRLGLVWDASGSGARRDHARELAVLEDLFRHWGNVEVHLRLARDVTEDRGVFRVKDGDWRALRDVLSAVTYDGGTAAAALSAPGGTELNLLFSDGLANYGAEATAASAVPLFALTSVTGGNAPALRAPAERSGGGLLDLTRLTPGDAVAALTSRRLRLAGWSGEGISRVVPLSYHPENGVLTLAGVVAGHGGNLRLELEEADGRRRAVTVPLNAVPGGALAASRWAALQLAALQADAEAHRDAIRALGREFSLVTPETSLIVLDNVQDYVTHEITPPDALLAEYRELMARRVKGQQQERQAHLEQVVARFRERVEWWERDFRRDPVAPKPRKGITGGLGAAPARRAEAMPLARSAAGSAMAEQRLMAADSAAPAAPRAMAPAESEELDALRGDSRAPAPARISLKPWQPDAPYSRELRTAHPDEVYALYLKARPEWQDSTAFYLDAADILFEKGRPALALRVLSNLAEMNLESRSILRVLAYRLLQARQPQLAIPVLRRVLALAPNEPQSWRDLGLALAEDGQAQAAVDALWQVVVRPWHGRFPDVEQIALAELNAIVARSPVRPDTSAFDPRLLRNLPVGLRITLSWDADNTDIDLHVDDPRGEEAYYGNPLTGQGGRMSRDFTGGYGPEEFVLRQPAAGKYTVHTRYFGDRSQTVGNGTTLQVRISTGFGTKKQKDEVLTVRLTRPSDRVEIGEVQVGK